MQVLLTVNQEPLAVKTRKKDLGEPGVSKWSPWNVILSPFGVQMLLVGR